MSERTRYHRDPTWLWRHHRGTILLSRPGAAPRTLEGAAAAVWIGLDRPGTEEEVGRLLATADGGTPPTAPVAAAVDALVGAELIRIGDPGR